MLHCNYLDTQIVHYMIHVEHLRPWTCVSDTCSFLKSILNKCRTRDSGNYLNGSSLQENKDFCLFSFAYSTI